TTTSVIPWDATIPQKTEGSISFGQGITPDYAANLVRIEAQLIASHSVATNVIVSLIKNGATNAIAASVQRAPAANVPVIVKLEHLDQGGANTNIGYQLNYGPSDAGTLTVNPNLGGTMYRTMKTSEIMT